MGASGGGERCDLGEQQRAQIGQPGSGGGSAAARCPGGAAGATFPQAQQLGLGDPGDLLCSVWGCQEQPPLCICVCPGEGPGISAATELIERFISFSPKPFKSGTM